MSCFPCLPGLNLKKEPECTCSRSRVYPEIIIMVSYKNEIQLSQSHGFVKDGNRKNVRTTAWTFRPSSEKGVMSFAARDYKYLLFSCSSSLSSLPLIPIA